MCVKLGYIVEVYSLGSTHLKIVLACTYDTLQLTCSLLDCWLYRNIYCCYSFPNKQWSTILRLLYCSEQLFTFNYLCMQYTRTIVYVLYEACQWESANSKLDYTGLDHWTAMSMLKFEKTELVGHDLHCATYPHVD